MSQEISCAQPVHLNTPPLKRRKIQTKLELNGRIKKPFNPFYRLGHVSHIDVNGIIMSYTARTKLLEDMSGEIFKFMDISSMVALYSTSKKFRDFLENCTKYLDNCFYKFLERAAMLLKLTDVETANYKVIRDTGICKLLEHCFDKTFLNGHYMYYMMLYSRFLFRPCTPSATCDSFRIIREDSSSSSVKDVVIFDNNFLLYFVIPIELDYINSSNFDTTEIFHYDYSMNPCYFSVAHFDTDYRQCPGLSKVNIIIRPGMANQNWIIENVEDKKWYNPFGGKKIPNLERRIDARSNFFLNKMSCYPATFKIQNFG